MKTRTKNFFPSLNLFLTSLTLLFATAAQAQVPSYVPTNGLVGYWPFNGNANDESGNGNNGTVNGAMLTADRFGNANNAYSFDGNNDLIRIPHQSELNLSGDYSISIWFMGNYQNIYDNNWVLIAKRDDNGSCCSPNVSYDVFIPFNATNFAVAAMAYANGNYSFATPPNSLPVSLDSWQNLIITNTSDNLDFYLNGVLYFSNNFSSALRAANTSDVLIGTVNREAGAEWMNGTLDDIGIWNRALTADEVLALYNGCNVVALAVSGNVTPTQFTQETYTCPNTDGSAYNWTVTNGVIVSGQGTNSIDVMWANTGIGQISVAETNASNCTGDVVTYDVVVIPTNVEELSNAMILYPNPATTELNLQTTSDLIGSDLFVFDALGKQILKQQILSTNTAINTSSFAAGNYVVKVGEVVKRFEVMK